MRATQRPPYHPLVRPSGMDHHARDMTATFSADLTLQNAQAKLAEHNQWLPIDGDPQATLGTLVETNSTGPLRLGYGAWRDLLLGCQFYNGRGELITAGGRTVKNVAGYDLTKFMIGQHGIFGRIVTITTRTYRLPNAGMLATFEPDLRRLNALLTTPARPQWSLIAADVLLCGYLGDPQTIEFYANELPGHAPRDLTRYTLEEDVALRARRWSASRLPGFRAAVPPASISKFAETAQLHDWIADPSFGIVIGSYESTHQQRLNEAANVSGGSILFFDRGGFPLRLTQDPAISALLTRLKSVFDPDNALKPMPQEH